MARLGHTNTMKFLLWALACLTVSNMHASKFTQAKYRANITTQPYITKRPNGNKNYTLRTMYNSTYLRKTTQTNAIQNERTNNSISNYLYRQTERQLNNNTQQHYESKLGDWITKRHCSYVKQKENSVWSWLSCHSDISRRKMYCKLKTEKIPVTGGCMVTIVLQVSEHFYSSNKLQVRYTLHNKNNRDKITSNLDTMFIDDFHQKKLTGHIYRWNITTKIGDRYLSLSFDDKNLLYCGEIVRLYVNSQMCFITTDPTTTQIYTQSIDEGLGRKRKAKTNESHSNSFEGNLGIFARNGISINTTIQSTVSKRTKNMGNDQMNESLTTESFTLGTIKKKISTGNSINGSVNQTILSLTIQKYLSTNKYRTSPTEITFTNSSNTTKIVNLKQWQKPTTRSTASSTRKSYRKHVQYSPTKTKQNTIKTPIQVKNSSKQIQQTGLPTNKQQYTLNNKKGDSIKEFSHNTPEYLSVKCVTNSNRTCSCKAGQMYNASERKCKQCPKNSFKTHRNNELCKLCGLNSSSDVNNTKCNCQKHHFRKYDENEQYEKPCYATVPKYLEFKRGRHQRDVDISWDIPKHTLSIGKLTYTVKCISCKTHRQFKQRTHTKNITIHDLEFNRFYAFLFTISYTDRESRKEKVINELYRTIAVVADEEGDEHNFVMIVSIMLPLVITCAVGLTILYESQKKKDVYFQKKLTSLRRKTRPPPPPASVIFRASRNSCNIVSNDEDDMGSTIKPYAVLNFKSNSLKKDERNGVAEDVDESLLEESSDSCNNSTNSSRDKSIVSPTECEEYVSMEANNNSDKEILKNKLNKNKIIRSVQNHYVIRPNIRDVDTFNHMPPLRSRTRSCNVGSQSFLDKQNMENVNNMRNASRLEQRRNQHGSAYFHNRPTQSRNNHRGRWTRPNSFYLDEQHNNFNGPTMYPKNHHRNPFEDINNFNSQETMMSVCPNGIDRRCRTQSCLSNNEQFLRPCFGSEIRGRYKSEYPNTKRFYPDFPPFPEIEGRSRGESFYNEDVNEIIVHASKHQNHHRLNKIQLCPDKYCEDEPDQLCSPRDIQYEHFPLLGGRSRTFCGEEHFNNEPGVPSTPRIAKHFESRSRSKTVCNGLDRVSYNESDAFSIYKSPPKKDHFPQQRGRSSTFVEQVGINFPTTNKELSILDQAKLKSKYKRAESREQLCATDYIKLKRPHSADDVNIVYGMDL